MKANKVRENYSIERHLVFKLTQEFKLIDVRKVSPIRYTRNKMYARDRK